MSRMLFKIPQNTPNIYWTRHSAEKMRQYGLSEQRIRRVLNSPQRAEEGIAENTIAFMQPANPFAKKKTEIWAMIQEIQSPKSKVKNLMRENVLNKKIRIISVWRYPGTSPKGQVPEIPEEVWEILKTKDA